jgi:hypothetical protein
MNCRSFVILASGLTLSLLGAAAGATTVAAPQDRALQTFGAIPLIFEENRGQAGTQVAYLAHADGYTLFFKHAAAVIEHSGQSASQALRLTWVGANPDAAAQGTGKLAAISNYFLGHDPSNWKTRIANFEKVEYPQLYPGIDLVYYGNHRQLEYDLSVAPGTDPRRAELVLANAKSIHLDEISGDLLVETADGTMRMHKPIAYQGGANRGDVLNPGVTGERRIVSAEYVLTGENHVRFRIGRYDHSRPLIIDPVVVYGSYFGGSTSGATEVTFLGIATDASGFIYVAGYQNEDSVATLPTTAGSYSPSCIPDAGINGYCLDYFIAKFDPSQSGAASLIYSTYIGTSGSTTGFADQDDFSTSKMFAVDSAGNAYLTGSTNDSSFPTTTNALLRTCVPLTGVPTECNTNQSFLTKLSPDGSTLLYSTFFGQPDSPQAFALAVDNVGRAFVAGNYAYYGTLPVTAAGTCALSNVDLCTGWWMGAFDTTKSGAASLLYLEWLESDPFGIATDGAGNAYVYGEARQLLPSAVYAVPNGFQTVNGGGGAVTLLQKFNLSGAITYGSFFQATTPFSGPGTGSDLHASAIAADSAGRAFITGFITPSAGDNDIPLLNGLPVSTLPTMQYPYLASFDTTQSGNASLLYSTLILPSTLSAATDIAEIYPYGIATDGAGRVALTAFVGSGVQPSVSPTPSYPIVNPLANATPGTQNAVVSLFDTTQTGAASLLFSSPINGAGNSAQQVAIDSADNLYIAGNTDYGTGAGQALPVTPNGYQTSAVTTNGYPYLLKISMGAAQPPPTLTFGASPTTITLGQNSTLTWSSTNATSCTASGSWSGPQATSGTQVVNPTATGMSTYALACVGTGGSANGSATLTVNAAPAPPTVAAAVSPTTIALGQSASLTWSSTNATACTASGAWSGAQATSGTLSETPTATGAANYMLACTGAAGSASATAVLTVVAAPTVTLSVSPTSITVGQSATLTWSSTNANACTASGGWSGAQATGGNATVTPSAAGTPSYVLTCTGANSSSAMSTASLTVLTAPVGTPPSSGGKGSFELWALLGLTLLVAGRMRLQMARRGRPTPG